MEVIRKDVAKFIETRDGGIASDSENIYLSGGASESIRVRFHSESVTFEELTVFLIRICSNCSINQKRSLLAL